MISIENSDLLAIKTTYVKKNLTDLRNWNLKPNSASERCSFYVNLHLHNHELISLLELTNYMLSPPDTDHRITLLLSSLVPIKYQHHTYPRVVSDCDIINRPTCNS